jgi:hypothetical protein
MRNHSDKHTPGVLRLVQAWWDFSQDKRPAVVVSAKGESWDVFRTAIGECWEDIPAFDQLSYIDRAKIALQARGAPPA